ncbi:MAG: DNA cytosine methyltransferase [Lachnospiraceae bacterium]
MKKEIKASKRGLTFSFPSSGKFSPGEHFRYVIEPQQNRITIVPTQEGGNTISKKRSGLMIRSLIDIRTREIKEMVSGAAKIEVEIEQNLIVVRVLQGPVQSKIISIGQHEKERELLISRTLLKAAGGEDFNITVNQPEDPDNVTCKRINSELNDVIKTISLFSGAGMLDYAFLNDPSFELVYAAEYDNDAVNTYRENIGSHIEKVDIRTLSGNNLPAADLIIGGPPCQPFSNANRHESARGASHYEGDMFYHYVRLVKECDVKAFLIENVPALLSEKFQHYMELLRDMIPDYKIASRIVEDCDIGGFTKRKRAIIIGSRDRTPYIPEIKLRPVRTSGEALSKVDDSWPNSTDITESSPLVKKKISMIPEGGNWQDLLEEYWTKSVHSNMYRRLDRNKPSITLANWRKFVLSPPRWDDSGKWDRILSVSEASALQGFHKDFHFLGTMASKQQMVANGVTAAMGNFVRRILKSLFYNEWMCPVQE